jgi:hypothetical protein
VVGVEEFARELLQVLGPRDARVAPLGLRAAFDLRGRVGELARERLELQLAEEPVGGRAVGGFEAQAVEIEIDVHVRLDRRQLLRLEDERGVVAQRFAVGLVLDLLPARERLLD